MPLRLQITSHHEHALNRVDVAVDPNVSAATFGACMISSWAASNSFTSPISNQR
jgi:hypothetical protein